jgi:cytochrome c biogenesis factor
MVSWLWIGGLVLTLGAALAIAPERRRAPSLPRAGRRAMA